MFLSLLNHLDRVLRVLGCAHNLVDFEDAGLGHVDCCTAWRDRIAAEGWIL